MTDNSSEEKKLEIIDVYCKIVSEKSRLPTYTDFFENSVSEKRIKTHFGNLTKLHNLIEENYPDTLDSLAHSNKLFGEKRLEELNYNLHKYNKFFITTAVTEKSVFAPFYKSIKNYCEKNNALLLVIACSDVASTRTLNKGWVFDPILKDEYFIFKETRLNSRIFISNLKVSAKQINPITGLSRIGQRNGSYIFASPKQFLEIVPTSSNVDRSPMALMTTGAITIPDYNNEFYMSQRTSYIAESDHMLGGVIVEIGADDKEFHFRHVQAASDGSFIDFSTRYKPNGKTSIESSTLVLGDLHVGATSPEVLGSLAKLIKDANVKDIVIHDIFDGKSINHHDMNSPLKLAKKVADAKNNLRSELFEIGYCLNDILELIKGRIIVVPSNHDEFLERYLIAGNYVNDPENHYISLDLAKAYLDDQHVLKYAVERYGANYKHSRVTWLRRNDSYKISDVELGQHGDIGSGGKPATLNSIEKDVGCAVVGHIHSPAIQRRIYRVGTSTDLQLDYNKAGASGWMQTHGLVHDDGSVQLLNLINGDYHL